VASEMTIFVYFTHGIRRHGIIKYRSYFIRGLNVDTCTPLRCPGGFCFVALLCWYFWSSLFNICSIYQFIILEPQTTKDTAPATTCTPVMCEIFCPNGFALDAVSGCPRCGCNDAPTE